MPRQATKSKTTPRKGGRKTSPKEDAPPSGGNGKKAETVVIRKLDIQTFRLKIVGTTPLVCHRFSEKAKKAIEDKQAKKASTAKAKRDPKAEYLGACYVMPGSTAGKADCRYAIKAKAFKSAVIEACRYVDEKMTFIRGAVRVEGEEDCDLIPLTFKGKAPKMREDAVRIGMGTLDLRYRPEYPGWSCTVVVSYNAAVISVEKIVSLFHHAGFHVGVGEMRPSQNGDAMGTFTVEAA